MAEQSNQPPPIPTFRLAAAAAVRRNVFEALKPFVGVTPSGVDFDDLVAAVYRCVPTAVGSAVYHTCRVFAGAYVSPAAAGDFAWRVAGNVDLLKAGTPVLPWSTAYPTPFWAPVHVLTHRYAPLPDGKPAHRYGIRILAGPACPMVVYRQWSTKFVKYFARHAEVGSLGFTKATGKRPFRDAAELVGLRFAAYFEPALTRDDKPGFEIVACRGSLKTHNTRLMDARNRRDGFKCPNGYTHRCYQCPVGYVDCVCGTHPTTYVMATCSKCGQSAWHAKPEAEACLSCSAVPK